MGRSLAIFGILTVSVFAHAGQPMYKVTNLGLVSPNYPHEAIVTCFTSGNRIIVRPDQSGEFGPKLHASNNWTNIWDWWGKNQIGSSIVTNNQGNFITGPGISLNVSLYDHLGSDSIKLHPNLEFSTSIYANGMTDRYVYGAELDTPHSQTYTGGYYYEIATGEYHYIDPFLDNQNTVVLAMTNSGYMAVARGPGQRWVSGDPPAPIEIWKDGVKLKNSGVTLDEVYMNSKGQFGGVNLVDQNFFTIFDGATATKYSARFDGKLYRFIGMSDDGTALMHNDTSTFRSRLFKDGNWYSWQQACPELGTMEVGHGVMRDDGSVAAIGIQGGKGYLLRFDPVPEPTSILALGAGLALVARRRARKSPSRR